MNTYSLDNESCTECDKNGELVYNQGINCIHCQSCGTWFDTNGDFMLDTELTLKMENQLWTYANLLAIMLLTSIHLI